MRLTRAIAPLAESWLLQTKRLSTAKTDTTIFACGVGLHRQCSVQNSVIRSTPATENSGHPLDVAGGDTRRNDRVLIIRQPVQTSAGQFVGPQRMFPANEFTLPAAAAGSPALPSATVRPCHTGLDTCEPATPGRTFSRSAGGFLSSEPLENRRGTHEEPNGDQGIEYRAASGRLRRPRPDSGAVTVMHDVPARVHQPGQANVGIPSKSSMCISDSEKVR